MYINVLLYTAWCTRLTQLDLLETTKQHCPGLSERVDRLNYPSETQQQQPQHPIEVIKSLIDMLLAAISSPVYSDLFVVSQKNYATWPDPVQFLTLPIDAYGSQAYC